jgi:putative ABC transport system permease protein
VSVIIGVSLMIDSFRSTVVSWLDNILAADIYVSPAGQEARVDSQIDPAFVEQVRQVEGIAYVSLHRAATVFAVESGLVEVRAFTPQPGETRRPLLWGIGSPAEVFAALDGGAVMVSEVFARKHNLPLDAPSILTLLTEAGPQPFHVIGVFYDYAEPNLGYVLMRLQTYRAHWSDSAISNVGLFLAPEQAGQADAVAQDLQARFAGQYALTVDSNRGIKESALEIFDRTFTITAALRLLATVVAFIGVLSALMSLQLERTRELGTLRANGMSGRQLWGKTLLETGLMGLTAGLLAMPLGLALALILIYVINLRSFGWSLQFHFDPTIFVTALGVALAAALLAGLYPVFRMNRLQIAAALRDE